MKQLVARLLIVAVAAGCAAWLFLPGGPLGEKDAEVVHGLRVGSQQTYAPVEYMDNGGDRPVGLSVDLLDEIGRRIGERIVFVNSSYSALVPGLEAQRFDMASGGISDTKAREEKVDFVNYLDTGASILVRTEDWPRYRTLTDFCGKKVAALLGGGLIIDKVLAASEDCKARKLGPIAIVQFPGTTDAYYQLHLGRVDAYLGDLPALRAIINKTGDEYRIAQDDYVFIPYTTSWAFRKNDPLIHRVHGAMEAMRQDGSYEAILNRWKLQSGGLAVITINQQPVAKKDAAHD